MNDNQNKGRCDGLMPLQDGGTLALGIRFLAKQGDKIMLGIRSQFLFHTPNGFNVSTGNLTNLSMEQYEVHPGQTLDVDIAGLGEAKLTAELLDYMPVLPMSPHESIDPGEDELPMISPLLLRSREAVIDMAGSSATGRGKHGAVWIYALGVGRLIVSAENFQGAVKGEASQSRVDFEIGGERYQLLAGAPITRARDVWVQLDPNFQFQASPEGALGYAPLRALLAK